MICILRNWGVFSSVKRIDKIAEASITVLVLVFSTMVNQYFIVNIFGVNLRSKFFNI